MYCSRQDSAYSPVLNAYSPVSSAYSPAQPCKCLCCQSLALQRMAFMLPILQLSRSCVRHRACHLSQYCDKAAAYDDASWHPGCPQYIILLKQVKLRHMPYSYVVCSMVTCCCLVASIVAYWMTFCIHVSFDCSTISNLGVNLCIEVAQPP